MITEPEKNNTDVYGLLKKHWTTLYSAHRMTLVVQSKGNCIRGGHIYIVDTREFCLAKVYSDCFKSTNKYQYLVN